MAEHTAKPSGSSEELRFLSPDGVTGDVVVPTILAYRKGGPVKHVHLTPAEALDFAAGLILAARTAYAQRAKFNDV